ncbi:dTDP-4-amino-4,6-dideoxy-D-glucose acyltransferase [Lachnospiraceae bacterium]|nr:dTDP-4-amino-4,6-dideoxy-D-glucose acyltransferase [Lachnospiraceae bacterium]
MVKSFYSDSELAKIGFKSLGENVQISRKACIYGAERITIGNNVRIDDFCVLSGNITLGSYIHIAVYCALFGDKVGIEMEDFSAISSRSVIYAKSDDYSGESLTNPTVPEEYLKFIEGRVVIRKHVVVGSGTTILPGVEIGEGSAIGSMSLVNKALGAWGIYVGIPCQYKRERSKKLLEMEKELLSRR